MESNFVGVFLHSLLFSSSPKRTPANVKKLKLSEFEFLKLTLDEFE